MKSSRFWLCAMMLFLLAALLQASLGEVSSPASVVSAAAAGVAAAVFLFRWTAEWRAGKSADSDHINGETTDAGFAAPFRRKPRAPGSGASS